MAISISARRQALAEIARARRGAGWPRLLGRASVVIALLLVLVLAGLWGAGFFRVPPELVAVRAAVDEHVAHLQLVARNEAPLPLDRTSLEKVFDTVRNVPRVHRHAAQQEMTRLFEARETAEVDSVFGLPPDRRIAEIDRRIRAEEERRQAWAAERARRDAERAETQRRDPAGGGPPGTGTGGALPARGGTSRRSDGTEESRNARVKQRLDNSTAESRARRLEYRRLIEQRRIQLGLASGR